MLHFLLFPLIAASSFFVLGESPMPIVGVKEPPEWCGEAKVVKPPREELRIFANAFTGDLKDPEQISAAIEVLDQGLQQVPNYSDGYLMRATLKRMSPHGSNNKTVLADIDKAISNFSDPVFGSSFDSLSAHYSLRARVKFDAGQFKEALDDLDVALRQDFDSAEKMFASSGIKPDAKSTNACSWSLNELELLEQKFPNDYRIHLFQGLYQLFFCTFDEIYYQPSIQEFTKAARLNPRSPLPPFYLGCLWGKRARWTKEAWASGKVRDALTVKAITAYTSAIKLDPSFKAALVNRANELFGLQRYTEAIKDYDRILVINPGEQSALADRATARLDVGLIGQAISDYTQAISQRKPNDSYLHSLYEYRGDACMKVGLIQDAIADYSKAIELQFGSMVSLLSLQQIRGIYPEYNAIDDEVLLQKIHAIFLPEYTYQYVSKTLLTENGKWAISLLNDLYEKRGDAYLQSSDFKHGVQDFQRIFKGIPNFAASTNRWRFLGKSPDGDLFLDVQSVEFPDHGKARIWIKTITKESSSIQCLEFDLATKRLRLGSIIYYDSKGQVTRKFDEPGDWQAIIPESFGETWFKGLTAN